MKVFSRFVLIAAVALGGCGKKESAETKSSPPPAPENPAAVAADSPAQATPSRPRTRPAAPQNPPGNDAIVGAVHAFMTQQLRIFIQEKGRAPKDFSEFASARMDSVPRPPEGMKYVIDTTTTEVKVVRK